MSPPRQFQGTIYHLARRLSWTQQGRWYELTINIYPNRDVAHVFCECTAFPMQGCCKHLAAEWAQVIRPRLRQQGLQFVHMPEWFGRPEWATDEAIADHTYRRDGHLKIETNTNPHAAEDWGSVYGPVLADPFAGLDGRAVA